MRSALNALELAVLSADVQDDKRHVTMEDAQVCIQKNAFQHDKDGDQHYDVMSAFQNPLEVVTLTQRFIILLD